MIAAAMARQRTPEPELTPEQLEAGWRRLYRRGRPDSVAEALADPLYANLLRGMARALARRKAAAEAAKAAPAPVPAPTPAPPTRRREPPRRPLPRMAGLFDARRAAANDLESDDDE